MKKHLFTLLFAVFSAVSLLAVPANRQWRTVTQADGSVIEVMTVGDEFYHYTVNREGQQVRETNGVYQVVGEAPTAEVANARRAKAMTRRQRKDIGTTPNLAPKGVVILANFSDQSMQSGHTQATFDELYNSTNCTVNGGYPSAAQYFADQSNGAYRPQFDVYGPVTLSRTVAYYGKNDASLNADQYPTDAVVEACILANQQYSINWADYDSDNDGYLDFVYVIYAGRGEADGGASTTIWPHGWQVSLARTSGNCTYTAADCKVGGKVIEYYAMSSELSVNSLCGIGTFCYEFGHINGLPYLYDTNYGTNYTKCLTPNDWNIMDGGAYNGEGHCPPNYDPWQKDFFGWHTPVNLGSEAQNVTLYANGTANYQAYQINASGSYVGPTDSGVRYYIENRQATGWDAPLTGHGMLVWQVNYDATKWANNEVNTTANNPYYTVVSASGTKIGLDFSGGGTNYCPMNTFPGTKNVTTCTPISDRELTEITEASNIITCKFNGGTSDSNEVKWYVVGWINGADVGETDYNTFDDRFLFQDGKLTLSCAMSSYIAIKDQNKNFYYSRTATTVADTVVTLDWANGWTGCQKWAIPEGTNYLIIREASPKGSITLERVNKATYDAYPLTPTDTIPDTPTDTTIITQYEVAATMTAGTSASTATVNGQAAVKCGTSNRAGDMTVTVGAGAAYLSLYMAAWSGLNGVNATIEAPEGVTVMPATMTLLPDSGITGNTPFTLTGDEETYKHTIILKGVTAETALKISCEKRFVAWGAVYGTDSTNIPIDTIPVVPTDTTIVTQYEVTATMALGTNAYDATVNGQAAIKCGTGAKAGDMTVTVGAGAAYLSLYMAAWSGLNGVSATIEAPEGVTVLPATLTLLPDSGITSNTPFTLKGDEATYKHTVILKNVTAETALKISCEKRFVAWGAVYGTYSTNIPIDTIPDTPTDTIPDTPTDTFFKITVQADNTENGTVRGGGEYKEGETAVIMATPRKDCTFAGWNDGNTLNPRSILVTGDAEYTAIFRRNIPLPVVICSDTMYFTSADSIMIATRVYAPSQIEDYDQLIIATVNNKNVMGFQFVEDAELRNFRTAVEYTKNMPISNVSVVEVVPNGGNYRLRVADGELAPRCEDCTSATNQLYATHVGADWYFAQYDNSVIPEAAAYANRMILYNEEAPRFSSYRQVTGLNRSQTTVFKLHTPRNIPQIPEEIPEDTVSMVEEEKPMEDIPVSVEPKDTSVVISTPYVEFVHSFTLIIWADEAQTQVLVMITYDAQGNQLSVTRPSAVRRIRAADTDITFEINELEPSKDYHYTLIACEDDGSILTSLNSSFETATTASGIQDLSADPSQPLKILLDGQILILRAGKLYTLTGQEVK